MYRRTVVTLFIFVTRNTGHSRIKHQKQQFTDQKVQGYRTVQGLTDGREVVIGLCGQENVVQIYKEWVNV